MQHRINEEQSFASFSLSVWMRHFYKQLPEIMRGRRFKSSHGSSLYPSAAPAPRFQSEVRSLGGGHGSPEPSAFHPEGFKIIRRATAAQTREPLLASIVLFFKSKVAMGFNVIKGKEQRGGARRSRPEAPGCFCSSGGFRGLTDLIQSEVDLQRRTR